MTISIAGGSVQHGSKTVQAAVMAPRAEIASPIVTTTADVIADDGVISLREAINYANAHASSTIAFHIPIGQALGGTFTISPTTALPTISANGTAIDGSTQTGFTGNTNSSGPEIVLDGANTSADANGVNGLLVQAGQCVIKNVVIHSFANQGVWIRGAAATDTIVQGCYIGLDATGTTALPNGGYGLILSNGSIHNLIGGTTAATGNVIAGNYSDLDLFGSSYNTIQGNIIGLRADGSGAPVNGSSNTSGLRLKQGSSHNQIGGTTAGARNIIVAYGTQQYDSGSALTLWYEGSDYNLIQGNYVGTNKAGTAQIGTSSYGVLCTAGAENNTIGGTTAAARNIVGAHPEFGIGSSFADNNTIQGNYVGTDVTGTTAIGSGEFGIMAYACSNTLIGGATPGAGNIVAGNWRRLVMIMSEQGVGPADDNVVQGNKIGVDATGTQALGVQTNGVGIIGKCHRNVVGLATDGSGLPNIIAFNGANSSAGAHLRGGVLVLTIVQGEEPTGNTIRGNSIYSNDGGNGGLGINLQPFSEADNTVTLNDAMDGDGEANNQQNYPVLISAVSSSSTVVSGTLNSTPNHSFLIDFYRNTAVSPSGYGEGQFHLGVVTVSTDDNGDAAFNFSKSGSLLGQFISATATDTGTGDTSEFSANAAVGKAYTVSGRIADGQGVAIANANVLRSGSTEPAVTNSAGYYTLGFVPAGDHTLTPSKTGYTFTPETRDVTVTNASLSAQNFVGKTGIVVSGRISNSSGVAISGATVSRGIGFPTTTSNSAGYYTFIGVQPANVTVTPTKAGYRFAPVARMLTVGNYDIGGQNFIGASGHNVSGRIANSSGISQANISLKRTGSTISAVTNSAGYYTFVDVPDGTYTLTPTGTRLSFTPDSRSVTVSGADVSGYNFTVAAGYNLIGRVTTSSGTALSGVSVSRSGSAIAATTNSAGYFVFSNVPDGTYTVTPSLSGRTFTPSSKSVTVAGADMANSNFIASG